MFDDTLARLWSELAGRLHGLSAFRFVLQPLMAVYALAFLPYLVLRGPINRIARYFVAEGVKTS